MTHTYTNTDVSTTTNAQQTVSTNSVTDVVGNDFNAGFTVSAGAAGVSGKESLTLDNGDKETTNTVVSTTYSDSTAVNQQTSTQATVMLNDVDNTTPGISSACAARCHGPLPGRPSAVVFLDREFGSFMFQDPGAPGKATCAICRDVRLLTNAQVASLFASHEIGADQAREQFSDVRPTSAADAAIAFLVANHGMTTYGRAFLPASALTQGALATLMAEVAKVPARTALDDLTTGRAAQDVTGAVETVISRVFKVPAAGAASFEEVGYGRKSLPAAGTEVTRAEAAGTVFAALQKLCPAGCHLLVAPTGTSTQPTPAPSGAASAVAGAQVSAAGAVLSWFNDFGGQPQVTHSTGSGAYYLNFPNAPVGQLASGNGVLSVTPDTPPADCTSANAAYSATAAGASPISVQTKDCNDTAADRGFHLVVLSVPPAGTPVGAGAAIAGAQLSASGTVLSWFNDFGGVPQVTHSAGSGSYYLGFPQAPISGPDAAANNVLSVTPSTAPASCEAVDAGSAATAAAPLIAVETKDCTNTAVDQGFRLLVFAGSPAAASPGAASATRGN